MEISIGYDNTLIVNISNTKLLETVIDDTLSWKIHLRANYTQNKCSLLCAGFSSVDGL
jgi:hypothetical protein